MGRGGEETLGGYEREHGAWGLERGSVLVTGKGNVFHA